MTAPIPAASIALAALASAAPALMAAVASYNLALAGRLERAPGPVRRPRASVLVPARDEEENLRILLPLLRAQDWPDMEILVLDDGSADATAEVARAHAPAVRVIDGEPPPAGWLGKSWACARLAEEADGEVLIFCDADVRPAPEAVRRTLGLLEAEGAGALACLPRQILGTWAERAVIPLVLHLPILGLLPLPLVRTRPEPALSLGVGQWFAFTRAAYDRCGGHAAVRSALAEDMALARKVKEAGLPLAACLSTRLVSVRMYRDFPAVWEGFRKNLVVLTGAGGARPFAVLALLAATLVAPWLLAGAALAGALPAAFLIPGQLLLLVRLSVAVTYREPPSAWAWTPAGSLLVLVLAASSLAGYHRRDLAWKGRRLSAAWKEA